MYMGTTKNIQTEESLRKIVSSAFPDKEMSGYSELSEGMCNIAYRIEFSDGSKSILKIASQYSYTLLRNEKMLMNAEVNAMRIASQIEGINTAAVQFYDNSKTVCTGDYFFMEFIEGESFMSILYKLDDEQKRLLYGEVAQAVKTIAQVKGDHFGQLYDGAERFDKLYDYIRRLLENVLADAKDKDVYIGVEPESILSLIEADKAVFDEVTPMLVHFDLWEGNVFVKDGHVNGIIDWERAMWGDVLMEDCFRSHSLKEDFLLGYGQTQFSEAEKKRMLWYDIVLFLTMMTEGKFREYPDDNFYQWIKPKFEESWGKLNER